MIGKLLRLRFQAQFSAMSQGKAKGKPWMMIGIVILMIYACVAILGLFGLVFFTLCTPLCSQGQTWLYFALAATMAVALSFFGSIMTTQNQLFQAKDNALLLAMPIAPSAILASRMALLLIWNLLFALIVMVPAGVVYWLQYPMTLGGILRYVFLSLLLPFFTLALSAAAAWCIGKLTARLPGKNYFAMGLSVILLVAYLLVVNQMNQLLALLLLHSEAVAAIFQRYLIPASWFGMAVSQWHWLTFIGAILWGILPFALVWWLLSRSFIRIVTTESGHIKRRYVAKAMRVKSMEQALLHKEWRHLVGQPMYFLNASVGVVFLVIASGFIVIQPQMLLQIVDQLPAYVPYVPLFAALAGCAMNSMNIVSAPSVSLEGKNLWILKTAPVDAFKVLQAKLRLHLLLCMPATLLLMLAVAWVLPCSVLGIVLMTVMSLLYVLFTALLGLLVNLRFPKLDFLNEIAVIKRSASVNITVFAGMGVFMVLILLSIVLCFVINVPPILVLAMLNVIMAVICTVMYNALKGWGARRFNSL